jgi:hypothetical protein
MANPISTGDGPKASQVVSSELLSANYSSTSGAQFINSTVTGNTFSKPL